MKTIVGILFLLFSLFMCVLWVQVRPEVIFGYLFGLCGAIGTYLMLGEP